MSTYVVEVFAADTPAAIREAALVLTAVGIDNMIQQTPHGWSLLVAQKDQASAHHQLHAYWLENKPSQDVAITAPTVDSGWPGVVGYLFVIWLVPALSSFSALDFTNLGRLDASAVMQGEIWRAATALTLHADIAHITANSLFGCLFGLFVGRYLGSGFGWLMVLACGISANLLNAAIQYTGFRSIGASTATFAALGIVPAYGWRRGFFRGQGAKRGFAPIFGAIALLAFTGFGSENVDIFGHLFGFIAGIAAGLALAHFDPTKLSVADQQRAGGAALFIVAAAWLFAIL